MCRSVETSCRMICIGKSGARSSGPTGCPVPGWSTGGSGSGRSDARLYQASGSFDSSRTYLTCSLMRLPSAGRRALSLAHPAKAGNRHREARRPTILRMTGNEFVVDRVVVVRP